MRIVVFGSLNLDTTIAVDRRPDWGETILSHGTAVAAGGKGANQAAAAARLGDEQVVMVGRVGEDSAGAFLRAQLVSNGVVDRVRVDPARTTGSAVILRSPSGENAIVVAAGANDGVVADDLAALEAPDEPTVLVLQLEVPVKVVTEAAALAKSRGWHVLLNVAPVRPGADGLVGTADTLVANEVEAGQLTGLPVRDVAGAVVAGEMLLARGPSRVAVTLGEHGAVLVGRDGAWHAPAPAVDVVDTTAAGDAFVGALAVAIAEERPDVQALALAVAAGSLASTLAGAQPSLPDRARVLRVVTSVGVEEPGTPVRVTEGLPM